MSLLENKKLKKAAGLLNAQAPEGEFLAYINADEAKMLKDAGGAGLLTPQGIPTYFSAMYGGGAGDRGGDPRASAAENVSAGRDDRGNVQRAEDYRQQQNQTNTPPTVIEEPTFTGEGYDSTNTFEKPPSKAQEFFDDIKEFVGSGGMIGNTIRGIAELGVPMQKKMMTYSLNKRIDQISNKKDFHPGAYGYKIQDIQKDLQGVQDGTFTQNDFTKKYGSGDATNPNDASFNPATLRENDRELSNLVTPYAAYAIGESEPQESIAAKWYEGMNNQNGADFFFKNQYEDAKAKMKAILGTPSAIGQVAVGNSIFYNFLKQNSLNKGIL